MPRPALSRSVVVAALLVGLTACGSSDGDEVDGPVASGITPGATLTGTVGTPDDPDAFVIGLTDAAGATVTTLPAGEYTIEVSDPSRIHNWRLSGEGVDVATEVVGTGDETFTVTFVPGPYGYVCDPHPSMNGSITVT